MATSPRSSTPSVRFWQSGRNNLGAVLALLAGFITIGVNVWPLVPASGRGDLAPDWKLLAFPIGAAYLAAFFLADRRWKVAKLILVAAALVQILTALTFGRSYEAQAGLSGQLIGAIDLLPAALALIAAFLIGRAPTRTELSA